MTVVYILLGIVLFLLVLAFLLCGFVLNQVAFRKTLPLPKAIVDNMAGNDESTQYRADANQQERLFAAFPFETMELTTPDGARLFGRLLEPEHKNGILIFACHGCRSTGFGEFCFMAPSLYEKGYTVFMPDHRGCGESDGKYMGFGTFESTDSFLWLESLEKRFPELSVYLLGVSMGAATVLMMSDRIENPNIHGVIADCSYTSAWDEFGYQMKASFGLPQKPLLPMIDGLCKLFCHYSFKDAAPIDHVKRAVRPILFIHGDKDDYVPFFMEQALYDACTAPKEICCVQGAVHARSYYTNPALYEQTVKKFIEECEAK